MSNKNSTINILVNGDNSSLKKVLEDSDKRFNRTQKQAKKTSKDLNSLGNTFTQTANNVAIFNGQLDPIAGRLSAIGSGISRFGVAGVAGAAGVTAMTLAISKSVSALESYEQRQNRFDAVLQATSYSARLTAADLEELAQTTARNTLGNVDEMAKAIVALTTFRKVQGDTFKNTIKLATDARIAFGGDLTAGVVAFGKALNDPVANLGALSRKGIQFSDVQKKMIADMVESGNIMEAQQVIISELNDQFGGLASKEAPALASEMDSLGHSVDNMFEGLGRTEAIKALRGVLVQTAAGARKTADAIAEIHSERNIELRNIERLEAAQTQTYETMIRLQERYDKLVESGDSRGGRFGLAQTKRRLDNLTSSYEAATKALTDFIIAKKKSQESESLELNQGISKSLSGELADVQSKNQELSKKLEQRRVSLISGFEDEKTKTNRVFDEKSKAYTAANEKLLASNKRAEDKQIELLEQSIKTRNAKFKIEKREMQERGKSFVEINQAMSENEEKNNATTLEINNVRKEALAARIDIEDKYTEQLEITAKNRTAKLKAIDDKNEAARIAQENRERRAAKVAASEQRKRERLLSEINTGSGNRDKITFDYQDDLRQLNENEIAKTNLTNEQLYARSELYENARLKLEENYNADLKAYDDKEAAKTRTFLEQAGNRQRRDFNRDVDDRFERVSGDQNTFESLFELGNINEQNDKYAALEEARLAHLERIDNMEGTYAEKQIRREQVSNEAKKRLEELNSESRSRAVGDMWSNIAELGQRGHRKAFRLSKAAAIVQTTMNTIESAQNAYKSLSAIPYVGVPLGIAAAAAAVAVGKGRVDQIRSQQMPQAHDGIDYIPREGTYLLDGGERVVDSRLNGDLRQYLKNQSSSGSVEINFNVEAGDVNGFDQWYINNRQLIMADVSRGMRRR